MILPRMLPFQLSIGFLALASTAFGVANLLQWVDPFNPTAESHALTMAQVLFCAAVVFSGALAVGLSLLLGDRRDARSLSLFLALFAAFGGSIFGIQVLKRFDAVWLAIPVVPFTLSFGALLRFSQQFPNVQRSTARREAEVPRRFLRDPSHIWTAIALCAAVFYVLTVIHSAVMDYVGRFVWPAVVVLAFMNLRRTYLLLGADERQRITWIVAGLALNLAILLFSSTLELIGPVIAPRIAVSFGTIGYILQTVAHLVLVGCLATGIFVRGAFDAHVVVRKTALYGVLGPTVLFLFAAIENLVASQVAAALGLSESAGAWIAGATIAVAIGPLHDRLRRTVDNIAVRLEQVAPPDAAPNTPAERIVDEKLSASMTLS